MIKLNGFPTAEQKRFHNDLRQVAYNKYGGRGELHHIFGARWKLKGFHKPGEWLVIMLPKDVHDDIANYSFESERGLFIESLRDYKKYFAKNPPLPSRLVEHYNSMLSKQHRP